MLRKAFLLLAIFFGLSVSLMAQGVFQFEVESHDFGLVTEGEKPTFEFRFTNVGNAPIILENVRPSCGCTTPIWPKEPVLPQETGVIKVVYNSKGRIGQFNKSVSITSNASQATKKLYIKGVVERVENVPAPTAEQKKNSPTIVLDKTSKYVGKTEQRQKVVQTFTVTNTGKQPLKINKLVAGCHCVSFTIDKESIASGESAVMTVIYTPNQLGEVTDVVTVMSNDVNNPKVQLTLSATVVESLMPTSPMMQGGGF